MLFKMASTMLLDRTGFIQSFELVQAVAIIVIVTQQICQALHLSISFSGIFAPILGDWYHYRHFTDKATDLSLYPITREQIQDSNSSPSNSKACHACNQFTDVFPNVGHFSSNFTIFTKVMDQPYCICSIFFCKLSHYPPPPPTPS